MLVGQVAFCFSGQGAQYPGMGKELYEKSPAAKTVFDVIDKSRPGTLELCFSGTTEELAQTINTQPCLYACQMATLAAVKDLGIMPSMLAGFSLGEISALAASGSVSLEDGLQIVSARAALMQEDAELEETCMLAVLKLSAAEVEKLCRKAVDVYPVNYNCPGQTVVACKKSTLTAFRKLVSEHGGRAIPLRVNAGFHSPFMERAATRFKKVLEGFDMAPSELPLYSNFTADVYEGEYAELCSAQINHPVRWEELVLNMKRAGATRFVEIGPGKVLSGLISKIDPSLVTYTTDTADDLETLLEVKNA